MKRLTNHILIFLKISLWSMRNTLRPKIQYLIISILINLTELWSQFLSFIDELNQYRKKDI